jgi:hypothetical protein
LVGGAVLSSYHSLSVKSGADKCIGDIGHGLGPRDLRGPERGGHATISYATNSKHRRRTFLSCPEADKKYVAVHHRPRQSERPFGLSIESSIINNLNYDQIIENFDRDKARKSLYKVKTL